MSTQNKQITVIDSQILSGSGDTMRDALGLSIDNSTFPLGATLSGVDSKFISRYDLQSLGSEPDGLINKYTYAYRIYGNSNNIISDKHWKTYLIGGEFSEEDLLGIYSNVSFLDHYHSELNPYSLLETKQNGLFETSAPNYISIQPVVNFYESRYNTFVGNFETVTQIPNAYNFINENVVPVPTDSDSFEEKQMEIKNIFRFGIPNGDSFVNQTSSLQPNILIATPDVYEQIQELNYGSSFVPYYFDFKMNFDTTGQFVSNCVSNDISHYFLKILKDTFNQEDGSATITEAPFVLNSSIIGEDASVTKDSAEANLRIADTFEILEYGLNSYNTVTYNFDFILDSSEEVSASYDNTSVRRLEKTIPSLRQISSLVDFLNSNTFTDTFIDNPINTNNKYNETIAYRMEKTNGSETQNVWFLNLEDIQELNYFDSQVKFEEDYTLSIYKYVLVAGTSYSYSDIRASRTIADLGEVISGTSLSTTTNWCLEMFDPYTDETVMPLYSSDNVLTGSLNTGEQLSSTDKYIADFQVELTPSVKIVEVPLMTKQIQALEAPTNTVSVIPSYIKDNSQTLMFHIRYDLFVEAPFPTPLTSEDSDFKEIFDSSYDLLEEEEVTVQSKSIPITLEVYRIEDKPQSKSDFEGSLIASRSLKIRNEQYAFPTTVFYNKVQTNKKYFYYFRIINEAGSPAHGSKIFQAEMIDDGGYKFAIFDSYFESELEVKPFNRPIESFKKLLNIVPNIENVIVNDEGVDYSDTSENQKDNVGFGQSDDPVWDKTFKIRLTSKKTGKKIDINLTHKLV